MPTLLPFRMPPTLKALLDWHLTSKRGLRSQPDFLWEKDWGAKVLGGSPAHCLWHLAEVSCISHWKSLISAPWWSHKQLPCKLRHQKKLTKLNIPSPARVHWNRFIFMRNVLVLGTKSFHFASNQHCTPTCRCCFFFPPWKVRHQCELLYRLVGAEGLVATRSYCS